MKYPYILVLQEKWGDAFYLMTSPQDVIDFALDTLTERFNSGYYYKPDAVPDTFEEFFQSVHDMTLADAEELAAKNSESIKIGNRTATAEINSMRSAYAYKINEVEEYDQIEFAVTEKNGKIAWRVLRERNSSGAQYEGFTTETIENIKQGEAVPAEVDAPPLVQYTGDS